MRWILLLLLASCATTQLVNDTYEPVTPPLVNDSRPDVPRETTPVEPEPFPTEEPQPRNGNIFLPELPALVVGDNEHPLTIGKQMGDVVSRLTRNDLSVLAGKMPTLRGQNLRAEQFIRFEFENGSGVLRFNKDPDTDIVASELFFEEDKPMFQYAYILYEGAFPALQGQEIDFFGNPYLIAEASNTSIVLHGKDIEQYVVLTNDSVLNVNGNRYGQARVAVDPWSVLITYMAREEDDGGIRLRKGESIREKIPEEMLLNPLFDIEYRGMESNANATFALHSRGNRAQFMLRNVRGQLYEFDLAANVNGTLVRGDGDHLLHLSECGNTYCIKPNDNFPLLTYEGVMHIMEFRNVNDLGTTAEFREGETRHLVKLADTKRNESGKRIMDGEIRIEGTRFPLRILLNETTPDGSRLRIDFDGNGIGSSDVPLIVYGGYEIEIDNTTIQFIFPRYRGFEEEHINITMIPKQGDVAFTVNATNTTLYEYLDTEDVWGMTPRGAFITLEDSSDGIGEDLLVEYPLDFRAGIVRIHG